MDSLHLVLEKDISPKSRDIDRDRQCASKISGEDLVSFLRIHGQCACYLQSQEGHGEGGVVIDGWFNLEAVAAEINGKLGCIPPQICSSKERY